MLSLALLTVVALAVPSPAPIAPEAIPETALAVLLAPAPVGETPTEPLEIQLTPEWLPVACTPNSVHYIPSGECCPIEYTRTQFLEEQCINGAWVLTGRTKCMLPFCGI